MTALDRSTGVQTLTPRDLRRVHISRWSTTSLDRLIQIVRDYPARSVWDPVTGEYAVVNGWRHRRDIAHLFELAAPRDPERIVRAAMRAASLDAAELMVVIESDEMRRPEFYARLGLSFMEEVVSLELERPRPIELRDDGIRQLRALDDGLVAALIGVDSAAFPWVWRNSEAEFRTYVDEAGVELHGLHMDGRMVAYVGFTAFLGWGHIDRVAVHPDHQGRGLGANLTRYSLDRLARLGATRVGLSTQLENAAALAMYEKLGFQRVPGMAYRLYGRPLRSEDAGSGRDTTRAIDAR